MNKTRKTQPKNITVVVPVYNEESALPVYFAAMSEALSEIRQKAPADLNFTLLFVNDGSRDSTEAIIRVAPQDVYKVQLVNLSRNFGKETALAAGLSHATGDAVIPMDVDLQDPPEVIGQMIGHWLNGALVVNAKRASRNEDTAFKRMSASGFYKIFNMFSDRPIPENVGDFRLLDRQVVDAINLVDDKKRFNKEIFSWVGFPSEVVEFHRPQRSEGEGKWSFWKLWNFALDGMFSASTVPLRIWSYIGFLCAVAAFVYAIFIFVYSLVVGPDVPGYSSTILLILFFGGLNLLSVGILGEYIGRIYTEVRNRPSFIVRSTYGLDEEA